MDRIKSYLSVAQKADAVSAVALAIAAAVYLYSGEIQTGAFLLGSAAASALAAKYQPAKWAVRKMLFAKLK